MTPRAKKIGPGLNAMLLDDILNFTDAGSHL